MKKSERQTAVIVSFNDKVLDLPTLIELDDMDLEQIGGGRFEHPPDCGAYCPGSDDGC